MPVPPRLRRSVLYMPGSNSRALEKSRSFMADALIFDLEDAVAPEKKVSARSQVFDTLKKRGYGKKELIVRVNDLSSPWGKADLEMIASVDVDAILVPKVENSQIIIDIGSKMAAAGAPEATAIWCMIETPRGVMRAAEIASASHHLGALVLGTSDLAKDLRCLHTAGREPLWASLSWCILAARANGLSILDGVCLNLDDEEAFVAECRQSREMGFDGKTLIHPKTINAANEIFGPGCEEIEWSWRVIKVHEAARRKGQGVVLLDGKLVENLHVEEAKRIILLDDLIRDRNT